MDDEKQVDDREFHSEARAHKVGSARAAQEQSRPQVDIQPREGSGKVERGRTLQNAPSLASSKELGKGL